MWHAEVVQAWVVVMIAVVAVALALTVYGALSDRAKNRRRAAEMLGPPKRDIPHLPADARPPTYVTEAQARRRPDSASQPFDKLRERGGEPRERGGEPRERGGEPRERGGELRDRDQDSIEIAVGYASADFVTNTGTREVVLDDPLVLVCADAVETIRELLPALEQALRSGQPLVVVAPRIAPEVLGTLEVNAIQGKVPGVAITGDDAIRAQVAEASAAELVERTDLRSGWLSPTALGHLARWTSTRTSSRLVPANHLSAAE